MQKFLQKIQFEKKKSDHSLYVKRIDCGLIVIVIQSIVEMSKSGMLDLWEGMGGNLRIGSESANLYFPSSYRPMWVHHNC